MLFEGGDVLRLDLRPQFVDFCILTAAFVKQGDILANPGAHLHERDIKPLGKQSIPQRRSAPSSSKSQDAAGDAQRPQAARDIDTFPTQILTHKPPALDCTRV